MRNRAFIFVALLGCVLIAAPLLAQNPTGTIRGRVTHQDGPMPGVTVTADSPSMQGQKVTITGGAGEYIFRFLPPGDYTVSFALDGFQLIFEEPGYIPRFPGPPVPFGLLHHHGI